MLFNDAQKYRTSFKLPLFILATLILVGLFSSFSQAQNDYRNLILSDQYSEHYLSPYLTRYTQKDQITKAEDIISTPSLQSEVISAAGSIVLLDLSENTTWLSFDVINRSQQENWKIDFGTSYDGRFGFFDSAQAFTVNKETGALKEYNINKSKNIDIQIAQGQKSKVILKFEKSKSLPITISLKLLNTKGVTAKNFDGMFWVSIIMLIGMAFFFAAIALTKYNHRHLFISAYYLSLAGLLFVQNQFVVFNWPLIDSELIAYLIFLTATISLIIATSFWYPETKKFWTKPLFFIPVTVGFASTIASHFVQDSSHLFNFFLLIGPSVFIILLIPLICIMQGDEKNENSTPFMMAWFIFLFGICISILALSGILQPVSTAINAYWFALIPQAIFFIITATADIDPINENITFSKVLEIDESASITKLKQSKENTEQERLLKVIQQERKVLGELRKSEARRTEEMRVAKEIADAANQGKSNFLAVVSHEIRTPMTGLMGMVRMLLKSNLTKEQKEYAQTIQDSSDAMLALLNDILDFEKIEQGKMTFENISFDLRKLIQGVVTLMQGHAIQKNISLSAKIGDTLPQFVMGDPTRLRQVLLNLTGNAVKFTEEGGVIIAAEMMQQPDDNNECEIYFSIIDNGIGISEDAKKDLFTPFSQANKTISRKFGGTGLGLAISKGLISSMGSNINISSTEGEGSTFFFTLKMKVGHGSMTSTHKTAPTPSDSKDTKKILIIDDNHINRKVIRGLLSELPYEMTDAESAEEGLQKLAEGAFDIVLLDIELPDMNGDEAAKKIRTSDRDDIKKTPIIALSGNTQSEQIHHYYACGINAFVGKPIDPSGLIKTIAQTLDGTLNNATDGMVGNKNSRPVETIKPEIERTMPAPKHDNSELASTKNVAPIEASAPIEIIKKKKLENKESASIKIKSEDEVLDFEILESLKNHLSLDNINGMVADVLKTTDDIIADLQAAIKANDTDTVHKKCHDLKGMTGNFGLKEISELAKDLEQQAKKQPSIVITALIDGLPDAKKRAEEALSNWFNSNKED